MTKISKSLYLITSPPLSERIDDIFKIKPETITDKYSLCNLSFLFSLSSIINE